jgi:hypothetical protein
MGYGMDNRESTPGSGKRFSLLHSVYAGSETLANSHAMGTISYFFRSKAARAGTGVILPLSNMSSSCLNGTDNLTFT